MATKAVSGKITLLLIHSYKMFPALGFGAQLSPDWKVRKSVHNCACICVHRNVFCVFIFVHLIIVVL